MEATIIRKDVDKNGAQHTIADYIKQIISRDDFDNGKSELVDSLMAVNTENTLLKSEIVSVKQISQTIAGKNLQAVAVIDSFQKKFEYSDKNIYVSYTPIRGDTTTAGKFDYR